MILKPFVKCSGLLLGGELSFLVGGPLHRLVEGIAKSVNIVAGRHQGQVVESSVQDGQIFVGTLNRVPPCLQVFELRHDLVE